MSEAMLAHKRTKAPAQFRWRVCAWIHRAAPVRLRSCLLGEDSNMNKRTTSFMGPQEQARQGLEPAVNLCALTLITVEDYSDTALIVTHGQQLQGQARMI
eukprot:1159652-Pelagomonas_calceolata.AAC.6